MYLALHRLCVLFLVLFVEFLTNYLYVPYPILNIFSLRKKLTNYRFLFMCFKIAYFHRIRTLSSSYMLPSFGIFPFFHPSFCIHLQVCFCCIIFRLKTILFLCLFLHILSFNFHLIPLSVVFESNFLYLISSSWSSLCFPAVPCSCFCK